MGSFESFLSSEAYEQGNKIYYFYDFNLDQLRGTWGVDTSTDTVWAVLDNGGGIFAVDPAGQSSGLAVVPEPGSIGLLAGGMLTLALGCCWRRRAASRIRRNLK